MRRTPRVTRPVLVAALLALAAAPATASPPFGGGPPPPHDPAGMVARHAERLGLDAAAQAEIQRTLDESAARNEALRSRVETARQRLHELLGAPEPERKAVMAQAAALDALMAETHHNRLDAMLRIHTLLTPQQRAELVRLREELRPPRRGPPPSCKEDVRSACPDAESGPELLRCLAAQWDSISAPCRERLEHLGEDPPPPPGPRGGFGPPEGPGPPGEGAWRR